MVTPVTKKIERYIWGLALQIQSTVTAFNPLTFESVKGIAIRLTDQAVRQGTMVPKVEPRRDQQERKFWNNNNNHHKQTPSQAPPKKQQVIAAFCDNW